MERQRGREKGKKNRGDYAPVLIAYLLVSSGCGPSYRPHHRPLRPPTLRGLYSGWWWDVGRERIREERGERRGEVKGKGRRVGREGKGVGRIGRQGVK
jgi:hypothetical protein